MQRHALHNHTLTHCSMHARVVVAVVFRPSVEYTERVSTGSMEHASPGRTPPKCVYTDKAKYGTKQVAAHYECTTASYLVYVYYCILHLRREYLLEQGSPGISS